MKTLIGASLLALATFAQCQSPATTYPEIVKSKTLYAAKDLRGLPAPKLEFGTWLLGTDLKPDDLKGKVILIDFWATWCGPCRAVIPELMEFQKKFAKDLVVIGVSDEPSTTVTDFFAKLGKTPNYHLSVDPTKKLNGFLGVQGIPHALIISPDGIVRWQGFPLDEADRLTEAKLAQIIAASKAAPSTKNQ